MVCDGDGVAEAGAGRMVGGGGGRAQLVFVYYITRLDSEHATSALEVRLSLPPSHPTPPPACGLPAWCGGASPWADLEPVWIGPWVISLGN